MIDSLLWASFANGVMVAVLAPVLWLVSRRIRSAPLRHALWLLLLVKLVTPPLVSIPLFNGPAEPPPQFVAVEITAVQARARSLHTPQVSPIESRQAQQPRVRWIGSGSSKNWRNVGRALAYVWLAGSLVWYGFAGARLLRFAQLAAHSPLAPEAWQTDVRRLAVRLCVRRVPQVQFVAGRVPPLLWAVCHRPAIMLPEALATRLGRQERWMLLSHELAHLARGDHWTRRLELIVLGLYWWHPAAWLVCRQLREAEEQCCDAYVAWLWPHDSHTYGHLLLSTLDFLATDAAVPIGVSGFASATTFRARFAMILQGRSTRRLPLRSKLLVAAVAAPLLILSVVGSSAEPAIAPEASEIAKEGAQPKIADQHMADPQKFKSARFEQISAQPPRTAVDLQALEFGQVSCDATDLPLREVLKQISDGAEPATILFDLETSQRREFSLDQKVSLHVKRISRRSALNLVLKPLGIDFYINSKDGNIVVASGSRPVRSMVRVKHYVHDLTSSRWNQRPGRGAVLSLIQYITSTAYPESWSATGSLMEGWTRDNRPRIEATEDDHYLEIQHTEEVQREVSRILGGLRANYQPFDHSQARSRIRLLDRQLSWRFVATPFDDVIKQLSDGYDVNIHCDDAILRSAGVSRTTPLAWQATDAKLEDVLERMLAPLGLNYVVDDEVIKIVTSGYGYGIPVVTRTYAVFDLLNLTQQEARNIKKSDFQPLIGRIKSDVLPRTWEGNAAVSAMVPNLSIVVSHNETGHQAIRDYLTQLRTAGLAPPLSGN